MNLKRLEFTLTTRCNSQCLHCQAEASPLKNEVMNVEDAYNYLSEAVAVSNLESFMAFGGEPMLYPELAVAVFTKAHQLGIPRIDMITNGVWGKDGKKAEKWAEKLKAAGLNKADVSVDAFHAKHMPIEYPRNAALALAKAGVENVNWNVAVVESIDAENEYDKETKRILKKLEPSGIAAHFVKIIPAGRALQNLRDFFQRTPLHGPCESDPILGNPLINPDSICIEPSGLVDVCWHLAIGNAKETPLNQILSGYDWQRNFVIETLVKEGPMGLLKLPEVQGYEFQESDYVNKCHLCMEIRKTIVA
jgi:MoaA/NifB/PqqE/SkfB family radical SAM enzyme